MLLFSPLGIPMGAAEASERLVPRQAGRLDYQPVALGSLLPDLVHLMMNSIAWLEAYFGILRTGAWLSRSTSVSRSAR